MLLLCWCVDCFVVFVFVRFILLVTSIVLVRFWVAWLVRVLHWYFDLSVDLGAFVTILGRLVCVVMPLEFCCFAVLVCFFGFASFDLWFV